MLVCAAFCSHIVRFLVWAMGIGSPTPWPSGWGSLKADTRLLILSGFTMALLDGGPHVGPWVGRAPPPPSPAWGSEQRRAASLAGAASLAAPAQGPAACRLVDVFFLSL